MTRLTLNSLQLAVVRAVLLLQPDLEGGQFTFHIDGDLLKLILNLINATGKLPCWRLPLSELEFEVNHCMGIKHQAADMPSQLRMTGTNETPKKAISRCSASLPQTLPKKETRQF